MVRVFALCLSLALLMFGVVGATLGAAHWLIGLDFAAGIIGLLLDAVLWKTQGRWSVIVSFAMATALVVLFFAGIATNAAAWLSWCIFAVGVAFFAIGCARAFARTMYGGEIET
ncbi:MAG TPA: hypothetical protein VHB97_09595 [Polyangia bacterium]|nr:hypothetical protein [Polyangia bacterium]